MPSPTTTAATQLQCLDPTTLTGNRDIRTDLDLDDAFRASIRDLGVLSPIVAEPHDDGTLLIRSGHRRAGQLWMNGIPGSGGPRPEGHSPAGE